MRSLLLLAAMIAACTAPSQYNPNVYGEIAVGIDDGIDGTAWTADQRAALVESIPWVSNLGPLVRVVPAGDATVIVRSAALGGPCGSYSQGKDFVEVDPACAHGTLELQQAVNHELFHWFTDHRYHWLGHICTWPINAPVPPGCNAHVMCSAADDCLLSRSLSQMDEGPGGVEVYTGSVADGRPRPEDLELVRRCEATGCD